MGGDGSAKLRVNNIPSNVELRYIKAESYSLLYHKRHDPFLNEKTACVSNDMAVELKDSGVSFAPFFNRCKLPPTVKDDCDMFVKSRYSAQVIRPAPFQGYCSYTVFVGQDNVVQFRPATHKLDIGITRAASEIFGRLAPETEFLGQLHDTGLLVFSMRRIPGVSLADFRIEPGRLQLRLQRQQIVRDFARLQASSWAHAQNNEKIQKKTVGLSLRWRLELMANNLPYRFRGIVRSLLVDLPKIESLPWTLSHGDFLPSNIMVYPDSGRICGLVDWTEAEFLPFGVGMYGLEELLGEDKDGHFVYYPEAKHLRAIFWRMLLSMLPELAQDAKQTVLVKKAQTLGILLWHGIAFDDGKLDRAVEEGRDNEEIERLDVFLSSFPRSWQRKLRANHPFMESPVAFIRGLLSGKA
ncbi:hypothetical protein F5B20DRAFT_547929 [Whalleya microplaca]|nr:hypothetical protein F5B20DRAFT_547929 [Whalleya microplaca]